MFPITVRVETNKQILFGGRIYKTRLASRQMNDLAATARLIDALKPVEHLRHDCPRTAHRWRRWHPDETVSHLVNGNTCRLSIL